MAKTKTQIAHEMGALKEENERLTHIAETRLKIGQEQSSRLDALAGENTTLIERNENLGRENLALKRRVNADTNYIHELLSIYGVVFET